MYTFSGHKTLFFYIRQFCPNFDGTFRVYPYKADKKLQYEKEQGDKTEEAKLRSELQISDCN